MDDSVFRIFVYPNDFFMAIKLWELWSDLSWKDAASSKDQIKQGKLFMSFNEWGQVRKKNQEEKSNICMIYYYICKRIKTFWQMVSSFPSISSCLIVLLFSLHFCLPSCLETTRCIGNSLIANSACFLLKYYWKKKTWKVFWVPEFRWPNRLYQSPKLPGHDTD